MLLQTVTTCTVRKHCVLKLFTGLSCCHIRGNQAEPMPGSPKDHTHLIPPSVRHPAQVSHSRSPEEPCYHRPGTLHLTMRVEAKALLVIIMFLYYLVCSDNKLQRFSVILFFSNVKESKQLYCLREVTIAFQPKLLEQSTNRRLNPSNFAF